jgi:hypothetical protein
MNDRERTAPGPEGTPTATSTTTGSTGVRTEGTAPLAGRPTLEDLVEALRGYFGDRYEESYEHGMREFERVLCDRFDMDTGDARQLLGDLEQTQMLRFVHASAGQDAGGPRVGLFDEPGEVPEAEPVQGPTGRHWQIGRDAAAL